MNSTYSYFICNIYITYMCVYINVLCEKTGELRFV